jgi:hypothetical protein
MLGDSALAARLGQAGRERARAEFAASATVRRLKRLLVCHGRVRLSWEAIRRDPLLLSARWARW